MRICLIILLLSLSGFKAIIYAQTGGPVIYSIQVKGQLYDDNNIDNYVPLSKSYTYFDSTELSKMAADYLKAVFASGGKYATAEITRSKSSPESYGIYSVITKGKPESYPFLFTVNDTSVSDDGLVLITATGKSGLSFDTTYIEDPGTGETRPVPTVTCDADINKDLAGFTFYESWDYLKEKSEFVKKVIVTSPFVVYKRNYSDEYNEDVFSKRRIDVYVGKEAKTEGEILKKNIIYDVKIIPDFYVEEESSYDYSFGMPDPAFCSKVVIELLNGLKEGKVKAYPVNENTGEPDMSKPLSYSAATDSLSFSVRTIVLADTAKLRKTGKYKVNPVIQKLTQYKLNEYGDIIYDENYNPVIISEKEEIVGYDTIWPSPLIIRKEIAGVKQDTITNYKINPYTGSYFMDEFGNFVIENVSVLQDTVWNETVLGLTDFGYYSKDTIWHNLPADIHSIRFYEDWYIDREAFAIMKKVNGIALFTGKMILNRETGENELFSKCRVYFSFNK